MELGRYLEILKRWWWLMFISTVLAAGASYLYSQQQPRIYASRTTLMVGTSIQSPNPNASELGLSRTLAEIYAQLVTRQPITQAVIDKLGLKMSPEQLAAMIKINVVPSAQLLEITVLDVSPQRARLLADAVANELILQSPTGPQGKQEREAFIQSQLKNLQAKIQNLDQQIQELEDSIQKLASAVEISEAQSRLSELEKLRTGYQSNYAQMLSSLSDSSVNRLSVVEPAAEPTYPIAPNVKVNVLAAAAAGLVLALGVIVLLEFFNDTLSWHSGETQSALGIPVLGALSKVQNGTGKIVGYESPWSPEANALRHIRDSIFLTPKGQDLSALLITSSLPGEGKSFLAANLAAVIALPKSGPGNVSSAPGSSVILIDADLRKPTLHEMFDMPNLLGLTDVLAAPEDTAEAVLEKALRPVNGVNLLLLPAGRTPLDPGSLLNSPRFPKVLNLLKAHADLVIIDSAPILAAIETKAIANAVDGTVLVIFDGQTATREIRKTTNYFQGKGDNNLLGLVFNRVKMPHSYGYYSYYSKYALTQQGLKKLQQEPSLLSRILPFTRSRQRETSNLTLAEAADYLGVSRDTARRWCEQGRIQAKRKLGRWSVQQGDLTRFVVDYQNDGSSEKQPEPPGGHVLENSDSSSSRAEQPKAQSSDSASVPVS
jgi:capsular exopolysaccharide synthesis family protein